MAEQMTLFDIQDRQLITHKSQIESALREWSYTRRELLEMCPRWYYYRYYGASSRTAKTESQKEMLQFLKKLSHRYLRTGEIAHRVIRTYLNSLRQGETWSLERVLNWARDIYRSDLEYSRRYRSGNLIPNSTNSPALLLEFYYGFKDAEMMWTESEERLVVALTNFVASPELDRFRACGCRTDALIESPFYLKETHFSLRGKFDLAYLDNGRIIVVDWKIGDASGNDDSLQLLSYALGAVQKFRCIPSDIDLYRVHLSDNKVLPFTVCDKEILRTKARIIQDLEKMRAMDSYGRNAVSNAFTPCGQPRVCALCPFQAICPKE